MRLLVLATIRDLASFSLGRRDLRNASTSAIFDLGTISHESSRETVTMRFSSLVLPCLFFLFRFRLLPFAVVVPPPRRHLRFHDHRNEQCDHFEHCAAVPPLFLGWFSPAQAEDGSLRHLYSMQLDHVVAFACSSTHTSSEAWIDPLRSGRRWVPDPFGLGLLDRNSGSRIAPLFASSEGTIDDLGKRWDGKWLIFSARWDLLGTWSWSFDLSDDAVEIFTCEDDIQTGDRQIAQILDKYRGVPRAGDV